jgi:phosphopantetheinyl transferase
VKTKREMLDIYVIALPDAPIDKPLVPAERDDEVRAIGSELVRREKYFAWRLLETALWSSLGISIVDAGLRKGENGKWHSDACELSITHGGGFVAVAISSFAVGIDVQELVEARSTRFAERIMTDAEFVRYSLLDGDDARRYLTECWTRKEALFKMRDLTAFVPRDYESNDERVVSKALCLSGKECVLSVASEYIEALEFKTEI